MNEENTKKLFETYPKLYAQKDSPPQKSLMCYGFPGDGWFELINTLSSDLQSVCDNHGIQIEAVQVKSKWGGLRFYYVIKDLENVNASDEFHNEINKLVKTAESQSFMLCQGCGCAKSTSDKNLSSAYCQTCKYKT